MGVESVNKLGSLNQIGVSHDTKTNNLGDITHSPINRISKKSDAIRLSIADIYAYHRSDISMELKTLNNGVTIAKLAQESLNAQSKFLEDVENKIEEYDPENDDLNEVKAKIMEHLKNFNLIANRTIFNGKQIISTLDNTNTEIQIPTRKDPFTVEVPSTNLIGDSLITKISSSKFSEDEKQDISKNIKSGISKVSKYRLEFERLSSSIKYDAGKNIEAERNIMKVKARENNINIESLWNDLNVFNKDKFQSLSGNFITAQPFGTLDRALDLLT